MKAATGQKLKRILACFLSVCMLTNMAPISIAQEAQAEQITPTEENVQNTVSGSDGAAFFAFTRNASQTLTLEDAISLAASYQAGQVGMTNCPIIAEEDTLKIYNGEGLILLSQVNPQEYQNKKLILLVQGASSWDLVESVTVGETEYRYQGLGDETYPYCGVLSLDSSAQSYSIRTTSPLFQAISETASISNTLHFALDEDTGTAQPLLAAQVNDVPESPDAKLTCSVSINKGTNASFVGTIGGIVGTVKENAKLSLSLSNQCTDTLSVTGASDIGLFCNVMETGSALTAELAESKGGITITATAQGGNAGGLVGRAEDAKIILADSILTISGNNDANVLTVTAGTSGNAGGIAGKYTNSKDNGAIDLTGLQIAVTLGSTGRNVGGVFGILGNTGTGKFMIKGASETEGNHVDSVLTGSGKPTGYGGLIGIYQTNSKDSKLMIQNLTIHSAVNTNNSSAFDTYGGVLGKIITEISQNAPDNTYVSFQNLTVSSDFNNTNRFNLFGGIIGAMDGKGCFLKGEDMTVSCGSTVNAGEKRGGLFGYMEGGVLRLSGTTDLSGMSITAAKWRGQLIGLNENGLVYGVGDGNGTYGDTTGWKLKRSVSSTASDSGSWGQVLRLDGVVLKETTTEASDENTLLFYDESANTVQIQNPGADKNGICTIQNTRDFAAYALAYDYANAGGSALLKQASVDPSQKQQVVLSGNIDLTGTGILGVGRDHNGTAFRGSFDGGNHSITVDLGGRAFGVIGDAVATTPEGAGGLQVFDDAHTLLGLFAGIGSDTVIRNLEVKGTVLAGSSSNNNARFLSALAAKADGTISIQNVTVGANVKAASNSTFYQAGCVAQTLKGSNLSFENCTWSGTLQNNCNRDGSEIGGFLADAQAGVKIAFRDCILTGSIEEGTRQLDKRNSHAGGLVARFQHNKDKKNTITIENVTLQGVNMDVRYGGLLGNSWPRTDVVFRDAGEKGVTVTGCTLNTHNDSFGGLVRQASGYWNATASHSIVFEKNGETPNSFTGFSSETYPSALLVHSGLVNQDNTKSALYLEIGTWGVSGAAYYIAPEAVTVNVPNLYFDELAGITIDAVEGHDNAVVSLEHATPAEGECFATYQGQLTNKAYDNSKSRYFYNLNCYRNSYKQPDGTSSLTPGGLDAPDKVLLWSVAQYAAENIRVLFCGNANAAATITGTMDWKEYSYYPVTPLGDVSLNEAVVSFCEKHFEDNAEENRKPSNVTRQHYLMHYGLFYNVERNLSANGLTLEGTVGKLSDSAGSGALILNKASGDLTSLPVRITELQLNRVVLDGILINGMSESETYAPLLMNRVDAGVKLGINDLTLSGYSGGAEKAATSLVGRVGSTAAKMITLYFEKLGLNGKIDQSIFTRATILESFQYASESSGAYNFLSTDTKVTYGVELSNSGENGRNPDLQFCYYDGGYVTDEENVVADEAYVKTRFKREDPLFLPYVACKEDFSEYHELDINQKASGFTEGCGTYGDPYLIGDGQQLTDLAKFLEEPGSVTGFNVNFCITTDEEGQTGTMIIGQPEASYHTNTRSASNYVDILFRWDGKQWSKVEGEQNYPEVSVSVDDNFHNNAVLYLRNAYYQLKNDVSIPLTGSTYKGIGSEKNPFCGVIDGAGRTVSFSGTKDNQTNFGGLVSYSCGSVIRNITLDYATGGAKITLNNSAVPSSTNHPFFGGLVGYCMGGDTIIEQASVIFPEKPVQVQEASEERGIALTGVNGYDRLIAAGGYVGIVGGARNKDGYEPYGGGVIFRNMSGTTHNFRTIGEKQDGANTYFYCNPIAGRVLDGYVCYAAGENEGGITLDNTDKNYTIPVLQSLQSGTEDLKVTKNPEADSQYNITVNSPQGLWLLSAIVNSGAGAMDGDGQYKDVDSRFVEAYQLGKTRSASADYSKIGTVLGIDTLRSKALADEQNWGGTSVNNRVSYLVTAYTLPESDGTYYASRMSGKSSGSDASNTVNLTFGADSIDMSGYQNGFRGIGASYGDNYNVWNSNVAVKKVYRRTLRCASVSGAEKQTTLKLQMERHDYDEEYETRDEGGDGWANQGAGLFVSFSCTGTGTEPCKVSNLVLSGNVKAINHQIRDGEEKKLGKNNIDVTVGGFAGRTINSTGTLKFSKMDLKSLNVYGGTSTGGLIGLTERTGGTTSIQILDWSITDLTVSKSVTNDGSTGGLIGWLYSKALLTIGDAENACRADRLDVSIDATGVAGDNAGGLVGGVDECNVIVTNVTMQNVKISGTNVKGVAGVVAMMKAGTIEIQNFRMENALVAGDGCSNVGGLVGITNNSLQLCNVMLSDVSVMSEKANCNIGGFTGEGGDLNGYNVLLTDCGAALKENVTATSNTKLGRFVGNANSRKIQLVAVAADSRTVPQNQDLGGTVSQGNTKIIYGDYAAAKEDFPYPGDIAVDRNPDSRIQIKDGATLRSLTGNAVGSVTTQEGASQSIAEGIARESATQNISKTYYNSPDISAVLDSSEAVYLTTYQTEEILSSTVPKNMDFPILVLNRNATDCNTRLWNYIGAMVNVGPVTGYSGIENIKRLVNQISVSTCKWDSKQNCFVKGTCEGLVLNDKTFSMTGVYDNQKNQFTLVDVTFTDPTGKKSNGYHLYVPVLVKKVLEVKFTAKFLAGTNYDVSIYPSAMNYATADFDEPVTAYMEYNYNRMGTEWQNMLDDGEDLLWCYEKQLDLAQGSSAGTPLPAGTRLTLVDRQTGACYSYQVKVGDNVHRMNLSEMKDYSGKAFAPVPICDLLGITASDYNDTDTAYVAEVNPENATVRVGETYYRVASETDEGTRYSLTVGNDIPSVNKAENYLPKGEGYYLTIQVPKTEGVDALNHYLGNTGVILKSGNGAPAALIRKSSSSSYVLYEGVTQNFKPISTVRMISGETASDDVVMENGDSIRISLECELSLTDAGKQYFANLGPRELHHQFDIHMRKYLKDVTSETVIGAEGATYRYVVKQGEATLYETSGTIQGSENLDALKIRYGSEELKKALLNGKVTVTATIILSYPLAGQYFPTRSGESDQSGISVAAGSRVANMASQLPIVSNRVKQEDGKRYYTKDSSSAKLSFNTYDKDGVGDAIQQLGINPSDHVNQLMNLIYAQGDYDYSAISEEELTKAKKICYRLELFQKNNEGSYQESSPLGRMDEYLPVLETEGGDRFTPDASRTSMSLVQNFLVDKDALREYVKLKTAPLTGAELENKGFAYANYKLRLTVVLLDETGNELPNTKASDYIIYTNARIYPQLFRENN